MLNISIALGQKPSEQWYISRMEQDAPAKPAYQPNLDKARAAAEAGRRGARDACDISSLHRLLLPQMTAVE